MAGERKVFRCAVYTRKSSDNNLDLEFNSLDAQREAAEAYIKSQAHEGWRLLPTAYDDGGISGGTMDRPALQRLLADVRVGAVDIIVVYKVDRLTRSLADFARLVDLFERYGFSFVSVTQQFNTTTSMGRLTLNVLLSFAQFEREVAGERIRDKVAASRRKGIWMGGTVPFGYVAKDKKLVPDDEAAEIVRGLFRRYRDLGCVSMLRDELTRADIPRLRERAKRERTKRKGQAGATAKAVEPMSRGALYYLLRNRTYLGEARHKAVWHPGDHEPIVDADLFDDVQRLLGENRVASGGRRIESEAPLVGRLFDDRGNRMSPTWTSRRGGRYRYYVSQALLQGRKAEAGSRPRVSAVELEEKVFAAVAELAMRTGGGEGGVGDDTGVASEQASAPSLSPSADSHRVFGGTEPQPLSMRQRQDALRATILRVVLRQSSADVEVRSDLLDGIARGVAPVCIGIDVKDDAAINTGEDQVVGTEWINVPLALLPQARVNPMPGEHGADGRTANRVVVEAVAKARVWARALAHGTIKDFAELAAETGHSEPYLRRLIRLAWLAPGIVEGLATGDDAIRVDRQQLLQVMPLRWQKQRAEFYSSEL